MIPICVVIYPHLMYLNHNIMFMNYFYTKTKSKLKLEDIPNSSLEHYIQVKKQLFQLYEDQCSNHEPNYEECMKIRRLLFDFL